MHGPRAIQRLKQAGAPRVMLDLKIHDTPDTVRRRIKYLADKGTNIITVHASGGTDMLKAATEDGRAEIYGVTILSSFDTEQTKKIYGIHYVGNQVSILAHYAMRAGLNGIIASPREVKQLKRQADENTTPAKIIAVGIRSTDSQQHDQKRTDTPEQTISDGADLIIIGREITMARDPILALESILQKIAVATP